MEKQLIIIKGDEYRAKIEREIKKGDFFAEVYAKANTAVKEIVQEMGDYCKQNQNGFRIKYQGMGNNMILFCAGRGQGKTSAMQSFAKVLRREVSSELFEVDEKYNFHVLDSIDPTALDGEESILRVLIARLFFEYEEMFDKREKLKDEREENRLKAALLDLFQQCFANVDYLKGKQKRDVGQDDLEYLAGMGNSATLKKNLYKLIKTLLKFMYPNNEENRNYLVIQIDDVDLSVVDIFSLCEDVRNYFSIPNVIVLMAADYEHLRDTVYKKYLEENRVFWKDMGDKDKMENCHRMAARYVEKVFPSGHRINLPLVDEALEMAEDVIHVSYREYLNGDKHEELLSEEAQNCKDVQEQLFWEIYQKTGIAFMKLTGGMHPFLPHTLRQMTHFLKLLSDMQPVDINLAYQAAVGAEKNEGGKEQEEVKKLESNINDLKSYFLDYWCPGRLKKGRVKFICELDKCNQRRNVRKLNIYLKKNTKDIFTEEDNNYQKVIYKMRRNDEEFDEDFREALEIYFTLYFNGWFTLALKDEKQYSYIKKYFGTSLALTRQKLNEVRYSENLPHVLFFDVDIKKLDNLLPGWREGQVSLWIRRFCIPLDENRNELDHVIVDNGKSGSGLNEELAFLRFDALRAVLTALDPVARKIEPAIDIKIDVPTEESVQDKLIIIDENEEEKAREEKTSRLIGVKNVLANMDVQRYVSRKMEDLFNNYPKSKKGNGIWFSWNEEGKNIYGLFNSWVEASGYLADKSEKLKSVINGDDIQYAADNNIWDALYVCSENRQFALKVYKQNTQGVLDNIKEGLKNAVNYLNSNDAKKMDGLKTSISTDSLDSELSEFKYKLAEFEDTRRALEALKKQYNALAEEVQKMENPEEKNELTKQISDCKTAVDKAESVVASIEDSDKQIGDVNGHKDHAAKKRES